MDDGKLLEAQIHPFREVRRIAGTEAGPCADAACASPQTRLPPVNGQGGRLKSEKEHSAGEWNVLRFYNALVHM